MKTARLTCLALLILGVFLGQLTTFWSMSAELERLYKNDIYRTLNDGLERGWNLFVLYDTERELEEPLFLSINFEDSRNARAFLEELLAFANYIVALDISPFDDIAQKNIIEEITEMLFLSNYNIVAEEFNKKRRGFARLTQNPLFGAREAPVFR